MALPKRTPPADNNKFKGISIPTDADTPARLATLARKVGMSRSELARLCLAVCTEDEFMFLAIAAIAKRKGESIEDCLKALLTKAVRREARGIE